MANDTQPGINNPLRYWYSPDERPKIADVPEDQGSVNSLGAIPSGRLRKRRMKGRWKMLTTAEALTNLAEDK
jgi:hypothetical protein